METTLKQSGDSVYVVIPDVIRVEAGLKVGDPINVTVNDGKLFVERLPPAIRAAKRASP